MRKAERFHRLVEHFSRAMPAAETELLYNNAYELLVAVILSAQCTDKRVNQVTPALFNAFPDPQSLSRASADEIFPYIRSVSYPNNKAKHLSGMGEMLMNAFSGQVPSSPDDLQKLPGVGRKTAHVIASVLFGAEVMPVDTHVHRVSARIGLTTNAKTPLETERQLVKYLPGEIIPVAHHWLILHGRYICKARRPLCEECPLTSFCRYYQKMVAKQGALQPSAGKGKVG